MFKFLKTAALSAIVGLGVFAAAPASAQSGVYLGIGGGHPGPHVGIWFGDSGHSYRRPHHPDYGWHRPGCHPHQAVGKASRMGVRGARVIDVDRRAIRVAGHRYRDRVMVTFARAPGCPVIRYR